MRRHQLVFAVLGISVLGFMAGSHSAQAATGGSRNISQSYKSESSLRAGTIVSLKKSTTEYVELANSRNASKLVGVALDPDNSLIAVDAQDSKVQVATSGNVAVLVTTINGSIAPGDQITTSPFSGLGMKANGEGYIVGRAQSSFDAQSDGATTQEVTDKSGASKNITVGYVQLVVAVGYDAGAGGGGAQGLKNVARSLTGHDVSMARIVISLITASLAIIIIIVLVYAAIYGSIVSVGRNPLAKVSILQALSKVTIMVVFIIMLTFTLIYLLLR